MADGIRWPFWYDMPLEDLIPQLRDMRRPPEPKKRRKKGERKCKEPTQLTFQMPHTQYNNN